MSKNIESVKEVEMNKETENKEVKVELGGVLKNINEMMDKEAERDAELDEINDAVQEMAAGDLAAEQEARKTMETIVNENVIRAQKTLVALENIIDAYNRQYSDPDGICRMLQWAKEVNKTAAKAEKIAKENIWLKLSTPTGDFSHVVDGMLFEGKVTPGSVTIDIAKLKMVDIATYNSLLKLLPKNKSASKKLTIKKAGK